MDILAHGLWTYAIFHKTKFPKLATLFGVLSDLVTFFPFFILRAGINHFSRPTIYEIPSYVFNLYNFTHSLVVAAFIILLITIITRKFYIFLLGWPLHILIDIPTHEAAFFPTPFLYPIFNLKINGISWARPEFLAINYLTLVFVYSFIVGNKYARKSIRTNK